jgi:hypothetical protein
MDLIDLESSESSELSPKWVIPRVVPLDYSIPLLYKDAPRHPDGLDDIPNQPSSGGNPIPLKADTHTQTHLSAPTLAKASAVTAGTRTPTQGSSSGGSLDDVWDDYAVCDYLMEIT